MAEVAGCTVYWPVASSFRMRDGCKVVGRQLSDRTFCVLDVVKDTDTDCKGQLDILGSCYHISRDHDTSETHRKDSTTVSLEVIVESKEATWPCRVRLVKGDSVLQEACILVAFKREKHAIQALVQGTKNAQRESVFTAPIRAIYDSYREVQAAQEEKSQSSSRASAFIAGQVGYYGLFLPFHVFSLVAKALCLLLALELPSFIPFVAGKRLMACSQTLSLWHWKLNTVATAPDRLRAWHQVRQQRSLLQHEVTDMLCTLDDVLFVLVDFFIGYFTATYLFPVVHSYLTTVSMYNPQDAMQKIKGIHSKNRTPQSYFGTLQSYVQWLMDVPAGFKLNRPLASVLGNGILMWLELWRNVYNHIFTMCQSISCGNNKVVDLLIMTSGLTLQLSAVFDGLVAVTWNSYWIFLYFAKLNTVQFGLLRSLWQLFLGRKVNVLRHRVDSCEYDVGQLLLGTLLFTILTFLLMTTMIFFTFFGSIRLALFALTSVLWTPIVILRSVPLATVMYRLLSPETFAVDVKMVKLHDMDAFTKQLVLKDVGVSRQEERHDSSLRHQLQTYHQDAMQPNDWDPPRLQLSPVASPFPFCFLRASKYAATLRQHYRLSNFFSSWIFGDCPSSIPYSSLFPCHVQSIVKDKKD